MTDSPTLEVGFAINPDYGELERLQTVMSSTEAKVVADAAKIERATGGMLNLGGASAKMTAFGNASTQAGATAAAAMSKAEKAGEALSRQMEYQIKTMGMSKAAATALRAEENGLVELAGRLRTQEAELTYMRQKSAEAMRAEAVATRAFGTASAVSIGAASSAVHGFGAASQNARIAMLDMTHVGINMSTMLATGVNPMRALMMESGRLATAIQYGGAQIGGLVKNFAAMLGIVKVVRDAELAEAAATAGAQATAIASVAARAEASIAAAEVEIQLAEAAERIAVTDAQAAAASARLSAAYEAQTVATMQLTIAQDALAGAQATASETAVAAAAAETTSLGPVGIALGVVAVAAGALYVAFKATSGASDEQRQALADLKNATEGETAAATDLKKAIDQLHDSTVSETQSAYAAANASITTAEAYRTRAVEARKAAIAELELAKSKAMGANASIASGGPAYFGTYEAGAAAGAEASVRRLQGQINVLNGEIATSDSTIRVQQGKLAGMRIAEEFDKSAAAAGAYARQMDLLNANLRAGTITEKDYEKQVRLATQTRIAAENAAKASSASSGRGSHREHDHGNQQALDELAAQIRGQNALAAAYQVSDAAAIKAEALQKAEEAAIRHKSEVGAYYELELQKAVATRAAEGAKAYADLQNEADARKAVNQQVAEGLIPASQANLALQLEAKLRPLAAAASLAEGEAKQRLVDIMRDLAKATDENNAQTNRAQVLADTASGQKHLEELKLEASLIGETNAVRAVAIAQLQAEQYLKDHPGASAAEAQRYVDTQKAIAQGTADLATAQEIYNRSLSYGADLLQLMDDRAQTLASTLSSAFGGIGSGLGQAMTALSKYAAQQAKLDAQHKAALKAGLSDEKEQNLYRTASLNNQIAGTAELVGGLKSLFKEHSAGYKAMQAAEEALAVVQLVQTAKSVAAGAAKMFAELGPWAFPVVAAMIAVMASLGFSGGSSTQVAPPSSDDLQKAAGTGTVLGSPNDKSASIANSLKLVADNTSDDLQYSNAMLNALKSIDASIGAMAAGVAKQITVAGSLFDTTHLNLGSSGNPGFLGLFSSSTTRSLYDAGITLAATTVGNIVANGISGQTYQIVEQIKKKSGFLGIGGGTKTTYSTTTGALPSDIVGSIQGVIAALENGIVTAAGAIGVEGAKAMLDNFSVNIGKISFNGLDAQGIQDQLNAIFSSVGDRMATAILPDLAKFQKVGEGMFETLMRVASTVQALDAEFVKLGKTATSMGVDVDMAVASYFDSVSDFTTAADAYFKTYYSQAEQTAAQTAQIQKVFASINLTMPDTLAGFRALVDAQDLTTAAGQQAYAVLIQLAPAFAELQQSLNGAKSAADVLSERQNLLNQLWQLQGNTAAIRAAQLASLDSSNRALQEEIYALQDAKDAADAADKLRQAWQSVGTSIETEIKRIRGLSDATGGTSFASAMGQFNAATAAARGGDQTAAQSLPQLSQALLTAAANAATSRQELDRIQSETAASLQTTHDLIASFGAAAASGTALVDAAAASQGANAPTNDNLADTLSAKIDALTAEVAQLRADNNAGHAATSSGVGSIKRTMDNVTAESGGNSISTTLAA